MPVFDEESWRKRLQDKRIWSNGNKRKGNQQDLFVQILLGVVGVRRIFPLPLKVKCAQTDNRQNNRHKYRSHAKDETQRRTKWLRRNYPFSQGRGKWGAVGNSEGAINDFQGGMNEPKGQTIACDSLETEWD